MTRAEVIAIARSWRDTPWRHQGRLKGVGVDCVGFVAEVGREAGIFAVQEAANYKRRPDGKTLRAKMDEYLTPIDKRDLQPADVVLIAFGGVETHIGLIGDYAAAPGELSLIHAYLQLHRVVEHRYDVSWRSRTVAAYAIPGLP